jgi:hypothetical protein
LADWPQVSSGVAMLTGGAPSATLESVAFVQQLRACSEWYCLRARTVDQVRGTARTHGLNKPPAVEFTGRELSGVATVCMCM